VPDGLDVLVRHGPLRGRSDVERFGCASLPRKLWRLSRRPRVHVYGHMHGGYGTEWLGFYGLQRGLLRLISGEVGIWAWM
jgi:hypothetical protein